MEHGLAHRDAVSVFLQKPLGFEVTHQGARAQKRRLVTLPFFFCETHHFDVKGQALTCCFEGLHTGHRHKNPQPTIVFATVAHGVVMAAGEQGFCAARARRREVLADDIADGIDLHVIKTTGQHLDADLRGAGAVRVGEVGDGELALFCKARVAVDTQCFLPVPHLVAPSRGKT